MWFGAAPGGVGGWADPAASQPGRAAVPELPSWDGPGWWSEIAPNSLRKFAQAPAFQAVRAGPPFPYLRWSGPRIPGVGRPGWPPCRVSGHVLERQFLHAERLAFEHPVTGARVDVRSPLPADLARALERAG